MRKALAIDLDGTLLSTNTFRDYLSYCGNIAVHTFRWGLALRIVWWVMLRKLRLISHSRMKHALLAATASFIQRDGRLDVFVEQELLCLNRQVLQLVEQYRSRGHLLVLTTAAPDIYARPIAEDLHIDLCSATLLPSEVVIGSWQENVGAEKVRSLQRLLQVHKAELDAVITDHQDDMPLLRANASGTNYLVNPSPVFLSLLQAEPEIRIQTVLKNSFLS